VITMTSDPGDLSGCRPAPSAARRGPSWWLNPVGAVLLVVGTKEHLGIGRLVSGSVSH
jgi:hypothetical protein